MNIFDIMGPIRVGPSSSHTAGAARIGFLTRRLLGSTPRRAELLLHGSFAATGAGHGTDRALAAGLLGMLPKGLVLLISVSLAAGTTKLARKKVLVQNLYSLESLAYVDTLCLDKTGTVTTGKMQVERIIPLGHYDAVDLEHWSAYLYHSDDNNETYQALCRACKTMTPR